VGNARWVSTFRLLRPVFGEEIIEYAIDEHVNGFLNALYAFTPGTLQFKLPNFTTYHAPEAYGNAGTFLRVTATVN